MIQNADMRLESGTCNVCSAPCSSCMHLNRTFMGSKAEEFSDENCRLGEANQYSNEKGDGSSLGSRACERLKYAVRETGNMPCVYSNHDSLSENAKDSQALSEKYQDSKCLEGLDDSTSCISRTSNANLVSGSHQINSDRINILCSSASVSHLGTEGSGNAPSVDMSGLSEILSSKNTDIQENLSECCMENVDSSLTKERAPTIVSGGKSLADKENLINSTANVSIEIYPKSEVDGDNDVSEAKGKDHKHSAHDGLHEKAEELVKSPSIPEPQSGDESDELDIVEHDVKVCDICGDAGREDLLAICSRCSDGAEHTYCMREMLQKVPEGDWLCEECKYAEETANQRLDTEEKKIHKVSSTSQLSGKRPSESMEVASATKRQTLESSTGSPKASSPKKVVPLSQESTFKSIDKGKVKPGRQTLIRNHIGGNDIELARSLSSGARNQSAKCTLLKTNSFNNFNSKPRVKLVDEVVPQKQKGGGEHVSKNMETPTGMISKSMSFKSSNLGRSSATESKVKMPSPKSGTPQDLKASRHIKELGAFDRKFLSRIDRPVICSTMVSSVISTPKSDQKLTPHGETAKPSAVSNNREFKVNQDGKLSCFSKSMNSISSKSLESQVISERTPSVDETQQDRLPQSRETVNQVDKTKDSSSDHVRSGVTNASKNSFCHRCKDFGHGIEGCTISGTQEFGAEVVTATNSSKEETHKDIGLKAAIQAALLRRPEIHKKKEAPDQANEFPTPDTGLKCEVASQNQVLVSNVLKSSISVEDTNVRQEIIENSTFETSKCPSANDLNQLNFCKTDLCSQLRKSDSAGPTSGKPVGRDLPNHALAISSALSKMSAVPEYKYIWQGVFRVHRNGEPPDLYNGIQAHLSSCASSKVLEIVNKFLPEVTLNEVPRLSTWPSQFLLSGAKEDNIALYFFAKDIESYERHYKGLLHHMIRNDLALRGTFDGVELLIFASNQLPENSQRWNMLLFLWGIFRGRRINHSDSAKKICIPSLNVMPNEKDFPTAVMTLSETRCSPKRMDEESIDQHHTMVSRNFDIKETILDQTHLGSQVNIARQDSRTNIKSTSQIPTSSTQLCQEMNPSVSSLKDSLPEHGQYRVSKPPVALGTGVSSRIAETKANYNISVKQENSLPIPSVGCQEIDTAININEDKILERTNNDENQQRSGRKQIDDENEQRPKRKQIDDENEQRPKRKQIDDDLNINMEATLQRDLTVKGVNCQLPYDKKVQHIDLSDTVMEASAVSCQKMPWNEVNGKLEGRESSSKRLQTGVGGIYGRYHSGARDSFNGSFASLVNDLGSCSSVEIKGCKEACDEKIIHEDFGTMERTFFPVDNHNKNDPQSVLNNVSLKGLHEYSDQFKIGVPNLELALGGETKPSQKGMLPFFVGTVDKKNNQEKTPDILADEREDESVAASLSLSLSFPSPNKEQNRPVSKAEPLPDGRHVNTSLLLFGKFTNK